MTLGKGKPFYWTSIRSNDEVSILFELTPELTSALLLGSIFRAVSITSNWLEEIVWTVNHYKR